MQRPYAYGNPVARFSESAQETTLVHLTYRWKMITRAGVASADLLMTTAFFAIVKRMVGDRLLVFDRR